MVSSKMIDRICCAALAVMLILTSVIWIGKASAGRQKTVEVGYEGLFDQSLVHTIDIEMADWEGFISTATQEEYTQCNVTIDGEKLSDVGIRAKGNTSLSSVATMGSSKYSFKIEFDHYVKGRLYRGLDKLSLNNLIYDATMMKDYLSYTLMGKMEVPSPLCSFVEIRVNGEPWGLYLAAEGVEDAFLERNNLTTGELYKPDSMNFGGGRGNGRDFDMENFRQRDSESGSEGEEQAESGAEGASNESDFSGSFGDSSGSSFGGSSGDSQTDMFVSSGGQSAAKDEQEVEDEPAGEEPETVAKGTEFSQGIPEMPSEDLTPPDMQSSPEKAQNMPAAPDGSFTFPEGMQLPEGFEFPGSGSEGGGFGGFNFGMGNSDVKLMYTDDDPDSYANIFDSAKTKIGKKDKARLIAALKTLSSEDAKEAETAVYTDEVIRYLVAHDFVQNDDSYTGMMVHNYYLYEQDGKLAIIPWDYNLAFGGMIGSDGASVVNSPIDSPVSSSDVSDRPLVAWIFEDEEALTRYHELYDQFISEIVESGWLAAEIDRVSELIRPYVEEDENSFYTAEEFDEAISAMQTYCALRGESIRGQLEGSIPSTTAAQREESDRLIDASALSISAMGSMNNGMRGGPGGGFGGFSGFGDGGSFPFGNRSDAGTGGPADSVESTTDKMPRQMDNQSNASMTGNASTDDSGFMASMGASGGTAVGTSPISSESQIGQKEENAENGQTALLDRPSETSQDTFRNGGFTPPGMEPQSSGTAMSWWKLGVYVLLLLLTIAVLIRVPSHNR